VISLSKLFNTQFKIYFWVWSRNDQGDYTIKSGYIALLNRTNDQNTNLLTQI